MIRAIFPCSYYLPETAASLYITDNIVHACVANGMDVQLYTPTPTRSVPDGASWKRREDCCNGRLHIHRFHLYGEGKNPLLRALRYLFCEILQLHYCLWMKYDIAFIDSTPPIQGLKLPLIKWFRGKPIVYNAQDIFPDSLISSGLARKEDFLWKIGRIIERITYRYSDKIIVISDDFKQNLLEKGVPEEKIEVIYNWVDQDAVMEVPRENNKLIAKYNLDPNKFYITYCGNIGLSQNMNMLLDVAIALQANSDIQFVLVGNGVYKEEVKRIIMQQNICNVTILPFQPYEDIHHVFSLGDVGIIISKPGVGTNSVPSKTWSIMSASRPVLASFDDSEIKNILTDNECGIFTKAGDNVALIDAINKLYHNKDLCKKYGENGRKYILSNLTKEENSIKYVNIIHSVMNKFGGTEVGSDRR